MKDFGRDLESRRRVLKGIGAFAASVQLPGLIGCSEPADPPPPADAGPAADPQPAPAEQPRAAPAQTAAPAGSMARLSEDDPQAKALAYRHEASTVDAAAQPRYQPGQVCSNCALYVGEADAEWGGCSIFPGKLVKGTGWCNVYAPKS